MGISEPEIRHVLAKSGVDVDFSGLPTQASFQDAGLDSMDMMNIFLEIEEQFKVKIPDEDIPQIDSIAALMGYLQARAA